MRRIHRFLQIFLLLGLAACQTSATLPGATATPVLQAAPPSEALAPLPFRPGSSIRFDTFNIEEGLSQSVANDIVQDSRGFLWIGTQDGLNRYDGYAFTIYKPNPDDPASLSDGWVTALYAGDDGSLWVGTNQGGLNHFDIKTDTFTRYRHNPDDPNSLTAGTIQVITQDRSGMLWVGTRDGLNRLDPVSGAVTRYLSDPDNPTTSLSHNTVQDIFQDSKGALWVGTVGGLSKFNPSDNTFQNYHNDAEKPASLSYDSVVKIVEDLQGNLWVGTSKGLNRYDPVGDKFIRYLNSREDPFSLGYDRITDVLVDRAGVLWVGTDFGLDRFDTSVGKFIHYRHSPLLLKTISSNSIKSLFEDREGVLWIGTFGGGINKYSRAQDKFAFYRHDPEQPKSIGDGGVFAIHPEDSGLVWVGTFGKGLQHFDPRSGQVVSAFDNNPDNPYSLNSSVVWAIHRDRFGQLWVGTDNGLDLWDEQSGAFIHHVWDKNDPETISGNVVFYLYEDSAGELWIGTRRGLDRYDRSSRKFVHYSDASDPEQKTPIAVGSILEDHDENILWVATLGFGLYRYDKQAATFERFVNDPENPASLANDIVLDIFQDENGVLWLATGGGGVSRFNPATKTFSTLSERKGLANNFVYCIIEDEQGFLWMSTNYGVSKFDPRDQSFQNYTTSDGLQSNEFNQNACARGKNGAIYFGGVSGLNRFLPEEVRASNYQAPVVLTDLTIEGKPFVTGQAVETVEDIRLEWPQNSFEFEFASLSLAEPRKNRYAYRLEGFDTAWNLLGAKRAGRYTNLPGGTYTLHLKATNGDGTWNETGRAIRITVIPPFWQTGWFIGLVGLTLVMTGVGGYRLRVNSIEAQKQELERQVTERTREIERLFEQTKELAIIEERNRLARELHDSAKQKAFAALAQLGTASGLIHQDVRAAKIHVAEAENLVYDVIQELTFLIQEMYPLALQEKGLATTLREYAFEWETRTDIGVSVRIEGERRLTLEVEQALYRIVQESLANIARHSRASRADICVLYTHREVSLSIKDNGQGFNTLQKPKGIGLRSIQERARSVGGQTVVESEPGAGTHIRVTIPTE